MATKIEQYVKEFLQYGQPALDEFLKSDPSAMVRQLFINLVRTELEGQFNAAFPPQIGWGDDIERGMR